MASCEGLLRRTEMLPLGWRQWTRRVPGACGDAAGAVHRGGEADTTRSRGAAARGADSPLQPRVLRVPAWGTGSRQGAARPCVKARAEVPVDGAGRPRPRAALGFAGGVGVARKQRSAPHRCRCRLRASPRHKGERNQSAYVTWHSSSASAIPLPSVAPRQAALESFSAPRSHASQPHFCPSLRPDSTMRMLLRGSVLPLRPKSSRLRD